MSVETRFMTPEEVAASDKLPFGNATWIRTQLRKGALRGAKVNGRWMVGDDELSAEEAINQMVAAGSNGQTRRRRRRAA